MSLNEKQKQRVMKHFQKWGVWGVRSLSVLQRMWVWSSEYSQIQKAGSWPVFKTWLHSIQIWIVQNEKRDRSSDGLLNCHLPPKETQSIAVVLEKILESPLDSKQIIPVNPKGDQPWIFIERTDAEVEAPILWLAAAKSWLMEKTLMLGKIEGKRRRGWQRITCWLASLTQWTWVWATPGDGEWQGSLACCSTWGCRVRHNLATEQQQLFQFIDDVELSSRCDILYFRGYWNLGSGRRLATPSALPYWYN